MWLYIGNVIIEVQNRAVPSTILTVLSFCSTLQIYFYTSKYACTGRTTSASSKRQASWQSRRRPCFRVITTAVFAKMKCCLNSSFWKKIPCLKTAKQRASDYDDHWYFIKEHTTHVLLNTWHVHARSTRKEYIPYTKSIYHIKEHYTIHCRNNAHFKCLSLAAAAATKPAAQTSYES